MFRMLFTIICGFLLLWIPVLTYADGGVFVYKVADIEGREPSQSAQQALVVWENGIETLHLQSNYSGPAENLTWVIPVPSRPKVEKSSWRLFREAEEVTRPRMTVIRREEKGTYCCLMCGCGVPGGGEPGLPVDMGVTKLESLNIGELHVDILSATDGGGLIRWLHTNGYAVPQKAEPVLQEYISKEFFFVAVKIQKESLETVSKGTRWVVETGLTPLAITFETNSPFFPLKISSVTSAPETELLLLTIAPLPLSPDEYEVTQLSKKDVRRGLGPALLAAVTEDTDLDFGPAIKEAQKRGGQNALIEETAIPVIYDGTPSEGHLRYTDEMILHFRAISRPYLEQSTRKWLLNEKVIPILMDMAAENESKVMWVNRFHTFLTPEGMQDITFTFAESDEILFSEFSFYEHDLRAYAPMGLSVAGVGFVLVPRRRWRYSRLRTLGFMLFLLALCVG